MAFRLESEGSNRAFSPPAIRNIECRKIDGYLGRNIFVSKNCRRTYSITSKENVPTCAVPR